MNKDEHNHDQINLNVESLGAEEVLFEPEPEEMTLSGSSKKDKEKIQKLEAEKQEYLDGWQRARAELVNAKKQYEDERKLFVGIGKQSILEDLIPVLDTFDAAFSNKQVWEALPETWRVGVEYIHKQFLSVLENHGVKTFGNEGDVFDALKHEPLEIVPTDDESMKNKLMVVIQKGYSSGEKIIRPAKVKVGE
jgi:molecular chaperone GrpE